MKLVATEHRVKRAENETVRNRALGHLVVGIGALYGTTTTPEESVAGFALFLVGVLVLGAGTPWVFQAGHRVSLWWATRDYPTDPTADDGRETA